MRCKTARGFLSAHIDGELPPSGAGSLESHLAACPECAAEYARIAEVHRAFADAERFPAPVGFATRVMANVEACSPEPHLPGPIWVRFAGTALVVLAIVLGIASGGTVARGLARHHDPGKETVMASLSMEAFDAAPPGSLGKAYLATTRGRR